MLVKYGFLKKERTQRYRCKMCKKLCSDVDKRTFGTLRSKPETILLIIRLLAEGMGIRSAARVSNCHRDTVLRVLKHAGNRSYDLLKRRLVDVKVNHVEVDETWTYVLKKNHKDLDPELDTNPWGDFYIFIGMESENKLMLMPTIGKRSELNTGLFAEELAKTTTGRFQLTSDGFKPYKKQMKQYLGDRIDFAQIYKEHHMHNATAKDKKEVHYVRSGKPDKRRITTSHVERINLTLRTHNKRFNRKTICFSKDEEYLAYSVYLFTAYYNFCQPHTSLGKRITPAMASEVTDMIWKAEDILKRD